MEIVLRPRRDRPEYGDIATYTYSGGVGHVSLEELAAALELEAGGIVSDPPPGAYPVTNIYVEGGKLIIEWDDGT